MFTGVVTDRHHNPVPRSSRHSALVNPVRFVWFGLSWIPHFFPCGWRPLSVNSMWFLNRAPKPIYTSHPFFYRTDRAYTGLRIDPDRSISDVAKPLLLTTGDPVQRRWCIFPLTHQEPDQFAGHCLQNISDH